MDIESDKKLYLKTKLNTLMDVFREHIKAFVEEGLLTPLFMKVLDFTMTFPTESLKHKLSELAKKSPEELLNYSLGNFVSCFSQRISLLPDDVYRLIVSNGKSFQYASKYQISKYYTNFYRPIFSAVPRDDNGNVSSDDVMRLYYSIIFRNLSIKITKILALIDVKGPYEVPLNIVIGYIGKLMKLKLSDNLADNIKKIISLAERMCNTYTNDFNENLHTRIMSISTYLSKMPLKNGLSENEVMMFEELTRNDVKDIIY